MVKNLAKLLMALSFFIASTLTALAAGEKATVRVGVFDIAPLVYIDDSGSVQGLFVDIIEEIGKREGWKLQYVKGSWAQGLGRVKKGEIDLMTAVMHLERRERFLDFPEESVFNIWGQLYSRKDAGISSVFDMEGKNVGVLKGGANGENFREMLRKFGITCNFIPLDSLGDVADKVADGTVDAGVFANIHGYSYEQSHKLNRTQIVFNPSYLKFATARGTNSKILSTIDAYLSLWKSGQDSPYHTLVAKHLGMSDGKGIPAWVWTVLIACASVIGITLLAAFSLLLFNRKLKKEVAQATRSLKRHSKELEKSNEDLATRNKELDEFTYVASHDLQEPLRKITAFSSLLQMDLGDDLSEDARENLDFLTDAASRMQVLVNDLLVLSRSGRRELKREKLSLDDCIDNAIDALDLLVSESGARIIRDELPAVWGDRTSITQLFQNLISNAIKFCQDSPVVRVTATHTDEGPVFGVCDNGIGIQEQYREQIFAPFKRLHGRGVYSGTGIGLTICRKAVERHSGKIWVEAAPESGSHFKFTLSRGKEETNG